MHKYYYQPRREFSLLVFIVQKNIIFFVPSQPYYLFSVVKIYDWRANTYCRCQIETRQNLSFELVYHHREQ